MSDRSEPDYQVGFYSLHEEIQDKQKEAFSELPAKRIIEKPKEYDLQDLRAGLLDLMNKVNTIDLYIRRQRTHVGSFTSEEEKKVIIRKYLEDLRDQKLKEEDRKMFAEILKQKPRCIE